MFGRTELIVQVGQIGAGYDLSGAVVVATGGVIVVNSLCDGAFGWRASKKRNSDGNYF